MKMLKLLFFLFLINMNGYSQKVKYISSYHTSYDTVSSMNYFKIGKFSLSFDDKEVFLDNKSIIKKDTSSFFFLEVYLKKVLIVSYYPTSQAHVSTGPGFRPIQKAEFILLENPKKRWFFDLKSAFNSASIIRFDDLTGELELKRVIKGKSSL
jgi:hypothetical protein